MSCWNAARRYGAESDGVFDVTVAPVAQVWGSHAAAFLSRTASRSPAGWSWSITAIFCSIWRRIPRCCGVRGQSVDLGGIAKGFACGAADRIARENGVESGIYFHRRQYHDNPAKNLSPDQAGRTVRQPFRFGLRDPARR